MQQLEQESSNDETDEQPTIDITAAPTPISGKIDDYDLPVPDTKPSEVEDLPQNDFSIEPTPVAEQLDDSNLPVPDTKLDEVSELVDILQAGTKTELAVSVEQLFCQEESNCKLNLKDNIKLCDASLDSLLQRQEYKNLLRCKNPYISEELLNDILREHITLMKERCVTISTKNETLFEVNNKQSTPMILFVETCPASGVSKDFRFTCKTESHLIASEKVSVQLNRKNSKMLLLPLEPPTACVEQFNRTSNTLVGEDYWVAPYIVPAARDVVITQGYLGSFSHTDNYALDFGMQLAEEVKSVRAGVVVTNNAGSGVHCTQNVINGNKYYKIFNNNTQVNKDLVGCPTCLYDSFPSVCWSANSANRLLIRHSDHTYASYMHLAARNNFVKFGQVVNVRDSIGTIGLSGWVNGAHLHFEIQEAVAHNSSVSFRSFPTQFADRYNQSTITPAYGKTLLLTKTDAEIAAEKTQWDNKHFTIEGISPNSASINCATTFSMLKDAPPICTFTVKGSSYWPASSTLADVQHTANLRTDAGINCIKQLLGEDVETIRGITHAEGPQSLPSAEQKSFRSITIDISCN